MAKEAIENELNCSICLDTYTDPKILQCFHVYCQKCLVKLVVRDQQGQLSLSCPICRQVTPIPASGTAGLQSAFHVNRFLEILDQHKRNEAECSTPSVNSALHCSEHGGREVELFCETCGELICSMCAIKGGKHHSHDYMLISESFERYREQVLPSLEQMEKNLTTTTKVLAQLDRQCQEITNQQAVIKTDIQDSSKRLHEIINKKETELICQLDQITRRKLKGLASQRNQIETFQAQLSSCLEFTRESLQTGGIEQREVLAMKTDVLKQVGELTTASQPKISTFNTEVDVVFSGLADAAAVCESYGRVYVPLKCVATGRGTEEAVVGELTTINVQFKECCLNSTLIPFEVEFVSEVTGVVGSIEHSMKHRGQGQYVMSYQPTVKGRHQLHIKADGQHIKGSPFSVIVKLPVEKLGTPILALNMPWDPWGVAVTGKGEVVVTEWGTHCVTVFSPYGRRLHSFGTCGSGEGQFQCPSGVAVDGEGNILVADRYNRRIQKFTADGQFLTAVGRKTVQFNELCGIAYSASSNMVYVVDGGNHRIQLLNSDLIPLSAFGKKGSGKGQFNRPRGVATDSTGRVYVADSGNHRRSHLTASF